MKKKNFIWSLLAMMIMAVSVGLSSCGDDDENDSGGGNGSTSAGVLDKDSSKRLKSVGNYNFYYKDNGLIDYITEGSSRYDFSYNPNKIVQTYQGQEEAVYTVSYNGLGFITRLDLQQAFQENGLVKISGSSTLSYDGTGHLTSILATSIQDYKGKIKKETLKATITWQNSKLMSVLREVTTEHDGQNASSDIDTYTYEYDQNVNDYHNKHHQYAPSLKDAYGNDPTDVLAFVKLLGYGPLYLPIQCIHKWEEGSTRASDTGSSTKRFSYGFNDDGSISYCKIGSQRYNYNYESLSEETRSVTAEDSNKERRHLLLFTPIH